LRTYRNPQTDGNYDALYELTQVRRYLYRLKPKKAYCCQPEEPGIVVQLKDWLKSEIEIQKRLQAPATETTGVTDNSIIAAKVITTLTIPELALLLRLLIDVEVIRSKNWKSLARLVANNVGVSHKETKAAFSDDYLYNQMHSSTVLTIDKVQELWQKVFNRLTELRLEAKQVGKIH
jgi:hypothetical protein